MIRLHVPAMLDAALYVDDLYQSFVPDESLQRRHCQSAEVHLMEDVASSAYLSTDVCC
jgi:hypothetical protein